MKQEKIDNKNWRKDLQPRTYREKLISWWSFIKGLFQALVIVVISDILGVILK